MISPPTFRERPSKSGSSANLKPHHFVLWKRHTIPLSMGQRPQAERLSKGSFRVNPEPHHFALRRRRNPIPPSASPSGGARHPRGRQNQGANPLSHPSTWAEERPLLPGMDRLRAFGWLWGPPAQFHQPQKGFPSTPALPVCRPRSGFASSPAAFWYFPLPALPAIRKPGIGSKLLVMPSGRGTCRIPWARVSRRSPAFAPAG